MKNFDAYKTTLQYPSKTNYTKVYAYSNGAVVFTGSLEQWEEEKHKHSGALIERVIDNGAYRLAMKAYQEDVRNVLEEFTKDLFEEFEVANNPKATHAFSLAWDRGHSSGFQDVYSNFAELVELIK